MVTAQLKRRLRMAAIDFLNPAPLMWDFEHGPERSRLQARYEINYTTPALCAAQLDSGAADLGLVPVAAYATTPGLRVVPGCAIAALDHVRSILLVVRGEGGIEAVRTVAADTSSRSSLVYTQILFEKAWATRATFVPHSPGLDAMLAVADAAILIGDPALLALEDAEARLRRTGDRLLYVDLAHAWHGWSGLPWISAFWAVRDRALEETGITAIELTQDLQRSRDHGLGHVEELVAEWSSRIAVPPQTIRHYLTHHIHYYLDEGCLRGLSAFYRYAAECGALPMAPGLKML